MSLRETLSSLSIRWKVILPVVLLTCTVCAMISIPLLMRLDAREHDAAVERVAAISSMLSREIGSALQAHDPKEVNRAVNRIGQQHPVSYILVAADSATLLGSFGLDEANSLDYGNVGREPNLDAPVCKVMFSVVDKKRQLVVCYAGVFLQDLQSVNGQDRLHLGVLALSAMLGGTLLVFTVVFLATRHLGPLVNLVEQAAKGDLRVRAHPIHKDETARVANALNTLFMNVETTGKRIETLTAMLDRRDHELEQEVDRRKINEKQIQLSNEIITKASALILVMDSTGGVTYASPSFELVLGYKPEHLLHEGWWKVTRPDVVERMRERNLTAKCACGEHPIKQHPYERQISDAGGNLHWVLFQDTVGLNKTLIRVGQDITERKLAEEQIREQAALLDITGDAITVRNLENSILYWNRGAEKLYGVRQDEAVGRPAHELFQQESTGGIGVAYTNVIENGAWAGELKQETRDGKKLIVDSRWTLVNDKEGKPKSILVVNTDVTEQRQLEAQIRRTQRLENIGTLAGGIAHDLNNVLSPILMAIQALQKRITDEKINHLLTVIDLSARRGASIVKQVLTFARGTEGERTLLQPKHILRELERIVQETFPRSIAVRFNLPSDLWTIIGDATQLHQIVLNLLVNARDAMPNGGTLTLAAENVIVDEKQARKQFNAPPGNYLALSVTDSGTGIPPEVMDKIFDPFFTTKEVGKGTGLGLSTVMAIVKSYGGLVTVDSTVGRGTEFKVFIPATNVEGEHPKEEKTSQIPSGRGESILVVDDELSIREMTKETLEAYGYKVQMARDGVEALALIEKDRRLFRLVLTDMMMPNMDGGSLIRTLHRLTPEIKIIAVSGLTDPETLDKIKTSRVEAFLPKPIQAENLLRILDAILHAEEVEVPKRSK